MIQDNINIEVLKQLQEFAQLYFDAILDTNKRNNKIKLRPGKYSAKDLADRKKCQMQEYYCLPKDSMFNEIVTISVGNFECSFNYRDIFSILDRWERMMKAGKLKTWFEVGNVEVKSAKVLLYSGDDNNAVIEKRMKLQRLAGNWWISTNTKRDTNFYYELNGVMFNTGKRVYSPDEIFRDSTIEWCQGYDDTKISELVLKMAVVSEYYRGITERVWAKSIDSLTATETPQNSTVNAKVEDLSTEDKTTTNTAFITPPTYSDVKEMVKTELAKNKAMKTIWHLELPDGTQCAVKYNYSLPMPYGDQYVYEELSPKDCHAYFSVTCNEKYVIDEIFQHLINPSKLFVEQVQKKCRAPAVLGKARKFYNAAFIGSPQ